MRVQVADVTEIQRLLLQQVTAPVLWLQYACSSLRELPAAALSVLVLSQIGCMVFEPRRRQQQQRQQSVCS